MKKSVIYILAAVALVASALILLIPLVKGPHTVRHLREESARLDTLEARADILGDSIATLARIDSLSNDYIQAL